MCINFQNQDTTPTFHEIIFYLSIIGKGQTNKGPGSQQLKSLTPETNRQKERITLYLNEV